MPLQTFETKSNGVLGSGLLGTVSLRCPVNVQGNETPLLELKMILYPLINFLKVRIKSRL